MNLRSEEIGHRIQCVFSPKLEANIWYISLEEMPSVTGLTEEYDVTCCGEKCADRNHQPATFVLITQVGRDDAEKEGTRIRRYLIMTRKSREIYRWL